MNTNEIPNFFETEKQKACMCTCLWGGDMEEIVEDLRLYDLIRRLYFVKMGESGDAGTLMNVFRSVKKNPLIMDVFTVYVETGTFPDNNLIMSIHV